MTLMPWAKLIGRTATVAVAAVVWAPAVSFAQDRISWSGRDQVSVTAVVDAPEACYTARSATAGAPAGAVSIERAVPITLTLQRGTGMCAQVVTPVTFTVSATVAADAHVVIFYIVNVATQQTTMRALALPPRPDALALPPLTLVGTPWVLIELDGAAVNQGDTTKPVTLMLQASPDRFVGSAGCNSMGGPYTLDGASLRMGPAVATRLACARGMDVEKRYLAAIDRVRGWRIAGRSLEWLDDAGAAIARFQALSGR